MTAKRDRVVMDLRRRILTGEWIVGDPLDSVAALARRHGVSDSTINAAIGVLQLEGLVDSHQGSRTYVIHVPAGRPEHGGADG